MSLIGKLEINPLSPPGGSATSRGSAVSSNTTMYLAVAVVAALTGMHWERVTGTIKVYLEARRTTRRRRRAVWKEGRRAVFVGFMVLLLYVIGRWR